MEYVTEFHIHSFLRQRKPNNCFEADRITIQAHYPLKQCRLLYLMVNINKFSHFQTE